GAGLDLERAQQPEPHVPHPAAGRSANDSNRTRTVLPASGAACTPAMPGPNVSFLSVASATRRSFTHIRSVTPPPAAAHSATTRFALAASTCCGPDSTTPSLPARRFTIVARPAPFTA